MMADRVGGSRTSERFGDHRILLDCRWLGLHGAGHATKLLLEELGRIQPDGRWILWGKPDRLEGLAFHGAAVQPAHSDPRALLGQRELLRIPAHDVAVFMNQIRPLRPGRSITLVHDTIALRYGGALPVRVAKRIYFAVAAHLASGVVTVSEFSRDCIARDLRVPRSRIDIVSYPVDGERAAAVRALRERLPRSNRLLFVGQFRRHKNLKRLCIAFQGSDLARSGGTLLLVGGVPHDAAQLHRWVDRSALAGVEVRPMCGEDELRQLMATSRALIVPSLEEGYGLPAFDAVASGLPVAVTRTGAMTELPPESAVFFEPRQIDGIRRAIDEVVERGDVTPSTPEGRFATVVLDVIERVLNDGADRKRDLVAVGADPR